MMEKHQVQVDSQGTRRNQLISLNNPQYEILNIKHRKNIGWQDGKQNGQMSGYQWTIKEVEAIRIKLTGDGKISMISIIEFYAAKEFGWLGWAEVMRKCRDRRIFMQTEA